MPFSLRFAISASSTSSVMLRFGISMCILIAVLNERDKSALGCFRRNMSDRSATGSAAETSVGDKCHVAVKSLADDRSGRSQHFRHSGAALRTFVADNYHIPRLDGARRVSHHMQPARR